MATQVMLPKLGQTMEEGTIVEWNKAEGDPVARGDILFQVESDKAVLEVESRAKGVLLKILLEPGVKVPVGTLVAVIGEEGEDIAALLEEGDGADEPGAPSPAEELSPPRAPTASTTSAEPVVASPARAEGERVFASPRARKLAAERGVDLTYVAGTGPEVADGARRVIERDVLAYLERQPAATPLAQRMAQDQGVALDGLAAAGGRIRAADVQAALATPSAAPADVAGEIVPMAGVRAIIADRMATSAHTTARVTLNTVVDVTAFVDVREKLKAAFADELGFSIGYNDVLAVIVARCLREFAYMNVRLEVDDAGKAGIRQLQGVNLGMAVDSERGLLVPVIHGADKMGVKELAAAFRALVGRAREGKVLPDDLTGGTFTITNLGMFGVDHFSPIINLPETAILGVGRIKPEPVVVDGEITVRQRMWLSLTFDHRLVDGAPAARFLQGIARYIESPYLLLA